jgi:hypothetical protein
MRKNKVKLEILKEMGDFRGTPEKHYDHSRQSSNSAVTSTVFNFQTHSQITSQIANEGILFMRVTSRLCSYAATPSGTSSELK